MVSTGTDKDEAQAERMDGWIAWEAGERGEEG